MDPFSRFREYAASFEEVVKTDDWSLLEPYFAEDAVYEVIGGEPRSAASTKVATRSWPT